MRDTSSRTKKEALGMFLLMLRKNLDQETVGFFFGVSQSVVSDSIEAISKTLNATLVKENLGYQAMPRETALRSHNRRIVHDLLGLGEVELAIIADGTYIYIEQSLDLPTQRLTYLGQKNRSLLKPMLLVLPSGYVLDAAGPFGATGTNHDATIMKLLLMENELSLYVNEIDRFIVYRGFQSSKDQMENEGYGVLHTSRGLLLGTKSNLKVKHNTSKPKGRIQLK